MLKKTVNRFAGRALTYAQASQPVLTSKIVRRLLSSGSKNKKSPAPRGPRISGMAAANQAAGVPENPAPLSRMNGMEAAARAARIP